MSRTVQILAGYSTQGRPAYEEVHVELHEGDRYRLLQSPGLALGIAAGDVFTINSGGEFTVVERGHNLCIQIFSEVGLAALEQVATPAFAKVGGRLDGQASKELVYTISVEVGFPVIEATLASVKARFPFMEWYYGNVYDPADGVTPLGWWEK
jgi:Domain of unknown function (DUF4265)